MLMLVIVLAISVGLVTSSGVVEEFFAWKIVDYEWSCEEARQIALRTQQYIPQNILPLGTARWKNKLFITTPRWRQGIPSSLNYIPLDGPISRSPVLAPYPNWVANSLPTGNAPEPTDQIINTFRVFVDKCDRLWAMDMGTDRAWTKNVKKYADPTLVVFDLNSDLVVRRFTLPKSVLKEASFFPNIVIDSSAGNCENTFAYIPDVAAYGLIVYSWMTNEAWRINHNFFHLEPRNGDYNVAGINFQWTDGIFGISLGRNWINGYRPLHFHPLSGTNEYVVSTEVVRNKSIALDPLSYHLFRHIGDKGPQTQASSAAIDVQTGVMFMTQINKDAIICWNTNKRLSPENLALVAQDNEAMIFTNDLHIDENREVWTLSNRLPIYLYRNLDFTQYNFRVLKFNIDEVIANSVCSN